MKKNYKLGNRRSLRFSFISFFATIALVFIHPALAHAITKFVTGNNSMKVDSFASILEISAGSLLTLSLLFAIVGMYFRVMRNYWKTIVMSLLGMLANLFFVLIGCSLFLEYWTPTLVNIACLSGGGFLAVLIVALIP